MHENFAVRGDFIQLDQLLKALAWVGSGGEAHVRIAQGEVRVNGQPETRKRAKLHPGDEVRFAGQRVVLGADPAAPGSAR